MVAQYEPAGPGSAAAAASGGAVLVGAPYASGAAEAASVSPVPVRAQSKHEAHSHGGDWRARTRRRRDAGPGGSRTRAGRARRCSRARARWPRTNTGMRPTDTYAPRSRVGQSVIETDAVQAGGAGRKPHACWACAVVCDDPASLAAHRCGMRRSSFLVPSARAAATRRPPAASVPWAAAGSAVEGRPRGPRGGGAEHECGVCGATCPNRSKLAAHTRVHTGERPYGCGACPARFKCRGDMRRHERTHAGERPHVCDVCHAAFGEAGALKAHNRTHTGERPYKCVECYAAFSLSSHTRTQH